MNTRQRGRSYERFPCELKPEQIVDVKTLGDRTNMAYTEIVRQMVDHALACPLFLATLSFPASLHPNEGK